MMKKLLTISALFLTICFASFADGMVFCDSAISPFVRTSKYYTYNVPEWENYPSLNGTTSVMFSLPHPDPFNFYLGFGSSINTCEYGFPSIGFTLNSAVSYSFHENSWPCCEILLLTRGGCGITFIKFIDFYMFADVTPYFTLMPAKDKSGLFFGIGPQVEYLQEVNWELYNQLSFGVSAIVGFRWR